MNSFNISFKWIGASTWILQIDDIKIACDPILCKKNSIIDLKYFKAKRRTNPQFSTTDFDNIDIWLLTHNHADHIDEEGVSKIDSKSTVYAHKNLKPCFKKKKELIHLNYMKWNERKVFIKDSIKIEIKTIPCVHGSNLISAFLTGGGNGYCLNVTKENKTFSVYITGDTINHPKVLKSIQKLNIDLLIPNMGASGLGKFGGPFTFTSSLFEKILNVLNPKFVLPVHHSSFTFYKQSINELYKLDDSRILKFNEGETVNI